MSFIKVAKTTPNAIFIGSTDGRVYKITNFDGSNTPITSLVGSLGSPFYNTYISSIEIGANDDELLVTLSNYNLKSVFYTNNGGITWTSKDEPSFGLPNIPIRYALFNPLNRNQVLLATELGVWSSNTFFAANPEWAPTNIKLAHVRCDQLRYRTSDNTVLVATHGRGVFTTKLNQVNPCLTSIVLEAPYDNQTSGTSEVGVVKSITATNKISGNANVTYKAINSIELKPNNTATGSTGFVVENGAVFYAYIQGCPESRSIEKK
jgi:hypothetical protein